MQIHPRKGRWKGIRRRDTSRRKKDKRVRWERKLWYKPFLAEREGTEKGLYSAVTVNAEFIKCKK